MKLPYTLAFLLFVAIGGLQAQNIADHALGLRLGDSDGLGYELSYQHGMGGNNRLEAGLGLRDGRNFNAFKLTGIYQWVWALEDGFNWYAGAGGGLGGVDYDVDFPGRGRDDDTEFFVFAAGNIGIEYNFDFPLLVSLDLRPEIGFNDFNENLDLDIALGVRYQF